MDALSVLIEMLKAKKDITDLESDILETFKEYKQKPFERKSAESRMEQNYTKYKDIFAKAAVIPGAVLRPSSVLSDQEIISNLEYQLSLLAEKEWNVLHHDNRAGTSVDGQG